MLHAIHMIFRATMLDQPNSSVDVCRNTAVDCTLYALRGISAVPHSITFAPTQKKRETYLEC